MKILTAGQVKELDKYTIEHEPISSIDLMERASLTFVHWFTNRFPNTRIPVQVIVGPGNNGGDGLAVARLLHQRYYEVEVLRCMISDQFSDDYQTNLNRLPKRNEVPVRKIEEGSPMPDIRQEGILIDAVFGSGLNRPVEGYWAKLFDHLNACRARRVAIDIPSGLFADKHTDGAILHAHHTLSFELPKLAFFFSENQDRVGRWQAESIGLDQGFIAKTDTRLYAVDEDMIGGICKDRRKFDHKGVFGHALLIMGSYGSIGAAIMATRACLRSGAGLVSAHVPKCGYEVMQAAVPEAMVDVDPHEFQFTDFPDLKGYDVIGIGCGLGKKQATRDAVVQLLEQAKHPMVIDADGLNILSELEGGLEKIPENSILTPHPKEFERLFGESAHDFEQSQQQVSMAEKYGLNIVLKGAHTCTADPEGNRFFNTTGNPGMATAGSGDVLTGIITGLLSRGYAPTEAALMGVYVHGKAGDLAAEEVGQESLVAGDIILNLGKAFKQISDRSWKK
ncbi:MAG: NAD(P)H-hydrate dehydratase [Saprospiraceae bacterium]|nr:NAD(P)H-hydrate dehydratase [Saprospiraceae bacterium]